MQDVTGLKSERLKPKIWKTSQSLICPVFSCVQEQVSDVTLSERINS